MSKIGNYNLILQEQAEELGFSTTQEALDNGFEVAEKQNGEPYLIQLLSAEEEQETAHEAWLKEKDKMLSILKGVQSDIAEWLDNKDHPDIKDLGEVITFMEDYCHD